MSAKVEKAKATHDEAIAEGDAAEGSEAKGHRRTSSSVAGVFSPAELGR